MTKIVLHHFLSSPYNEKIRWALDAKGLVSERRNYLPGPHLIQVQKLSGQTGTPVLEIDDEMFIGSAKILRVLEERFPSPSYFPTKKAFCQKIDDMEAKFDDNFVPRIRRALLDSLIKNPQYLARVFVGDDKPMSRLFYGLVLPLVKGKMRQSNGITGPESVEDGNVAAQEAFDFIADNINGQGYLITDRFTVGDLAVASVMAPAVIFESGPMVRPQPLPKTFEAWMMRWQDHPGADWVRDMYEKHREVQMTARV